MEKTKILIGGVPFGCDNIGDEAILSSIVRIVNQQTNNNAEITVSTGDLEQTKKLLNVNTIPTYKFAEPSLTPSELAHEFKNHDYYIWAGATGLSDYPEVALDLIKLAKDTGLKTAIFCTGMNDKLNPNIYEKFSQKAVILNSILKILSLGLFNLNKTRSIKKINAVKKDIADTLNKKVDLIVVRDSWTKNNLLQAGVTKPITIGADPAITLPPQFNALNEWPDNLVSDFNNSSVKKIGICISSQNTVTNLGKFANFLNDLAKELSLKFYFIPMNPITDKECMLKITKHLNPETSYFMIPHERSPESIIGLASKMDVIISSRLHLLIFSAAANTPMIGIERGSKVSRFLSNYGWEICGTVLEINYTILREQILNFLNNSHSIKSNMKDPTQKLVNDVSKVSTLLGEFLND